MKLLILFSQPWRTGGAETHVEALIKGMPDHQLFLAVNEGSDEVKLGKLCEIYTNLKVIKIQARGINIFRWKKDIDRLTELIRKEAIDIITAQQRTAGIWSYFLHRNTCIPYTVTMHDPWHRAKLKFIYAKIFPVIFAVSGNLAELLHDKFGFPAERIKLINNGIDFNSFTPTEKVAARRKLGLHLAEKLILHVSRLSSIKGAVSLTIVEAMKNVVQENDAVKLIIIGEGPLRNEIEKQIVVFNQQNGDKIEIRNFVEEIIDWYNAADILIGEGRVAMEALACLKPVVAIRNAETFIGAIGEANITYACDVNFDGKDQAVTAANMAREMNKAFQLEQHEMETIAAYIKQRLSIEKMVENYMNVFTKLRE